ncbi:MAG: hypothetical protein ACYCZB_14700 [Acidiphilium sp.]
MNWSGTERSGYQKYAFAALFGVALGFPSIGSAAPLDSDHYVGGKRAGTSSLSCKFLVNVPGFGQGCFEAMPHKEKFVGRPKQSFSFKITFPNKKALYIPPPPRYLFSYDIYDVCAAGIFSGENIKNTILSIVGEIVSKRGLYHNTIIYKFQSNQFVLDPFASMADASGSCDAKNVAMRYFRTK